MSRTVFVFAMMASLLMFACAAAQNNVRNAITANKASEENPLGGLKDTLKEFMGPFLTNGVLSSFTLSSIFGLFDQTMEELTSYGKEIDVLHEQLLKEFKDIENIFTSAKAAAEKASKSGALTQKINFIAARAETAKAQKAEIEKDKGIVHTKKKEAETAKKKFEDKEAQLASIIVKAVNYLIGKDTSSPSEGLMALVGQGAPIAAEMYTLFKTFSKAGSESSEAFQEAKLASKTIKKYLTESKEIQTCLNPQS